MKRKSRIVILCTGLLCGASALVAYNVFTATSERTFVARSDVAHLESQGPESPSAERSSLGRQEVAEQSTIDEPVSAAQVEVLVVELDAGTPLANVSLVTIAKSSDETRPLDETDADGKLELATTVLRDEPLFLKKEGFVTERLGPRGTSSTDVIVVRLARSASILGSTYVREGDVLPTGLRVMAWPETESTPFKQTYSELRQHPAYLWGETGTDGTFTLEGARLGTRYSVAVGGDGWVGPSASTKVLPGVAAEPKIVHRLYGVFLTLQDAGGPIESNPRYVGRGYGTLRLPSEYGSASVSWTLPPAALNESLDSMIETCRSDPWSRLELCTWARKDGADVPADLSGAKFIVGIPGYEPLTLDLSCQSLAAGLKILTVPLTRTGVGFGAISVDFAHASELLELHLFTGILLCLQPASGHELCFDIDGASRQGSVLTWEAIPAGAYRAELQVHFSQQPLRVAGPSGGDEVEIGAGVLTQCELPAANYGAVELLPELDGRPYVGLFRVRVEGADSAASWRQVWDFKAPPFRALLPEGSYGMRVEHPHGAVNNSQVQSVVVKAQAPVELQFELSRP